MLFPFNIINQLNFCLINLNFRIISLLLIIVLLVKLLFINDLIQVIIITILSFIIISQFLTHLLNFECIFFDLKQQFKYLSLHIRIIFHEFRFSIH